MPDNLSNKISSFISHATPEAPGNPIPRASQSMHGNGNIGSIIAGGNVTNVYQGGSAPMTESNQNMTPCPTYRASMSVTARQCLQCGDDLAGRRLIAWKKARQRRLTKLTALFGISGVVVAYAGQHFGLPYLGMAGAGGVAVAALLNK